MGIRDPVARAAYFGSIGLLLLGGALGVFVLVSDPGTCVGREAGTLDGFVFALPVLAMLSFLAMAWAASRSAEVRRARDGGFIAFGCLGQLVLLVLAFAGFIHLIAGCLA